MDNSSGALSKQAFLEKFLSINTSSKKIKYSLKSNIISCYNYGIITFNKKINYLYEKLMLIKNLKSFSSMMYQFEY